MNKSETLALLALALSKAQGEFSAVPMTATNPFLKNRYADLGSVISTAKPILARNGLSVSQNVYGDGGHIGISTLLMHSSGEWVMSSVSLPLGEEKGKSQAQVAGSIITYLRRYALAAILGLYADEDTDAETAQQAKPPAAKVPQNPPLTQKGADAPSEPGSVLKPGEKAVIPPKGLTKEQETALTQLAIQKNIDLVARCKADFNRRPAELNYLQAGQLITKISKETH